MMQRAATGSIALLSLLLLAVALPAKAASPPRSNPCPQSLVKAWPTPPALAETGTDLARRPCRGVGCVGRRRQEGPGADQRAARHARPDRDLWVAPFQRPSHPAAQSVARGALCRLQPRRPVGQPDRAGQRYAALALRRD